LPPIKDNRAINKKLPVNLEAGPKFDIAFSKLVLPFCVAGTICALAAVAQQSAMHVILMNFFIESSFN
tara:strand:- start:125 stop:328 length:204 start_codon:yes stop_codon:yes gene_type:complete